MWWFCNSCQRCRIFYLCCMQKRLVIGSCALHQYAVFYWDLGLWSAQLCKLVHIPFNGNRLEQNCQCIYDELMMDNFSIQMSNNHWNVVNEMFEMFVYYNTIYRYIISIFFFIIEYFFCALFLGTYPYFSVFKNHCRGSYLQLRELNTYVYIYIYIYTCI